jgi:hypothetical protein
MVGFVGVVWVELVVVWLSGMRGEEQDMKREGGGGKFGC